MGRAQLQVYLDAESATNMQQNGQQKMPTTRIELVTFCLLGRRSAN